MSFRGGGRGGFNRGGGGGGFNRGGGSNNHFRGGGGGGGGGGGSGGGSGSGGDAGPAAEKLRELLGSREAGVEPRPECVCGWRAWPAGGSGGSRGLGREPGSALVCSLLRAVALLSTGVGGLLTQSGSLTPTSCESVRVRVALLPSAGPCIFAARVCHASGSNLHEEASRW